MESYVHCYSFIFSMTQGDEDDHGDNDEFVQQLIIKV